jgi:hypothetical protein
MIVRFYCCHCFESYRDFASLLRNNNNSNNVGSDVSLMTDDVLCWIFIDDVVIVAVGRLVVGSTKFGSLIGPRVDFITWLGLIFDDIIKK